MGEARTNNTDAQTGSNHRLDLVPPDPMVPPPSPVSYRKYITYLVLLGIAGALYSPGKAYVTDFLTHETTDDASIAGHSAMISSKIGGVITNVLFDDDAQVKKGDLLVQLDQREYENTVKQLQADLSAATAVYESAKRELERGQFDNIVERKRNEMDAESALLEEAKADFDRGEFDTIVKRRKSELDSGITLLEEAKKTFHRMEELKKRNLVSEVEYDAAKTDYENNVAKVSALEVQLKESELSAKRAQDAAAAKFRNLDSRRKENQVQLRDAKNTAETTHDTAISNYKVALSKVWSIQAQLEQAKLNLEYTQIRAPDDGVVSRRGVEPGMVIKPNQPVTTLMSANQKWVIANFKETQLKNIYIGQPVEIEIDAIDGRTFKGQVQSISPGSGSVFALIPPDNATGNFTKIVQRVPVKIVFQKDSIAGVEKFLIPGISVYVKARIKTVN